MRVGELCAGYGGLALAINQINPTSHVAWYAETDPDATAVMAAHHPTAVNHGDITAVDWATVGHVDILTAGFPCQPFSTAGSQAGAADQRHLWPSGVLPAIVELSPSTVVLENVPGLLTTNHGEVYRTILTDLDQLGYTIRWTVLGACSVGLCHHRHRVFILATQTPSELPYEIGMPITAWATWPRDGICSHGMVWALPDDACGETSRLLPTPCASDSNARGTGLGAYSSPDGRPLREVIAMLPTPTAHIAARSVPSATVGDQRLASGRRNLDDALALLPTPVGSNTTKGGPDQRGSFGGFALERWGLWATAVARHADVTSRVAPSPTIIGKRGGLRINPHFTEWMMDLPIGWITDVLTDLNACNRLAGNGVIPSQAATALRKLLNYPNGRQGD